MNNRASDKELPVAAPDDNQRPATLLCQEQTSHLTDPQPADSLYTTQAQQHSNIEVASVTELGCAGSMTVPAAGLARRRADL